MTKQLEKAIDIQTFKPDKYYTKCCKSILFSSRPGEFVRCKCGKVAVDQTKHYTRVIGDYNMLEEYADGQPGSN